MCRVLRDVERVAVAVVDGAAARRDRRGQGARRAHAAPPVAAPAPAVRDADCAALAPRCSRASCSVTSAARSRARSSVASGARARGRRHVFLDEIGELRAALQGRPPAGAPGPRIERLGSSEPSRFDARIVAAPSAISRRTVRAGGPRRPVLPARRDPRSRFRRCASGARTFRCSVRRRSRGSPRIRVQRRGGSAKPRSRCSRGIHGPATCASSRMRSSA